MQTPVTKGADVGMAYVTFSTLTNPLHLWLRARCDSDRRGSRVTPASGVQLRCPAQWWQTEGQSRCTGASVVHYGTVEENGRSQWEWGVGAQTDHTDRPRPRPRPRPRCLDPTALTPPLCNATMDPATSTPLVTLSRPAGRKPLTGVGRPAGSPGPQAWGGSAPAFRSARVRPRRCCWW